MTRSGRPLRFLAVTLAGWTGLRVVMLWPAAPTPASVIRAVVPGAAAEPVMQSIELQRPETLFALIHPRRPSAFMPPGAPSNQHPAREHPVALALTASVAVDDPQIAVGPAGEMIAPRPIAPLQQTRKPRRAAGWSADLWLVARAGSNRQAGFGSGELGGAQAGVRIAYALDRNRRLAAFVRADTPLAGKGREVSAGLDWRPTRLPVRIVVEERVPLDGGRAVPAAGLVGGFGPVLHHGTRLEAYGQAGIVARHGGEGFADGALRATRPLGTLAGLDFDLGAGVWGGAQRDAARLDLGPTLGATLPISGHAIRLALDWRERVAGDARPGSGPALTIGASF